LSAVHLEDRDLIRDAVQTAIESNDEGRVEYRILWSDGSVRWISSRGRVRHKASGEPDCLMGVSVDITDRKQGEEAARELSGRLINAHEEERARLARELHDDVTQRLARLAIDAGRVEGLVSDPTLGQTIRAVREGLVRLSKDIHALSYRLHPSVLEDLGLAEALKAEIERVARQESLSVTTKLGEISESIPHDVALCLYRVAQEALRNVARHANARTVEISVRVLDGGLQLAVRDDGAGFDSALHHHRQTLGLTSMRERVHLFRGELDIESAPGQGTTVVAWVPLKRE
jgi:signal transduction histidine kinase